MVVCVVCMSTMRGGQREGTTRITIQVRWIYAWPHSMYVAQCNNATADIRTEIDYGLYSLIGTNPNEKSL